MRCPSCGSRQVGTLTLGRFYCWVCCVELFVGDNSVEIYEVEEDGSLVSLGRVAVPRDADGTVPGTNDGTVPGIADGTWTKSVEIEGVPVGR